MHFAFFSLSFVKSWLYLSTLFSRSAAAAGNIFCFWEQMQLC
jgi:hypothetical protein